MEIQVDGDKGLLEEIAESELVDVKEDLEKLYDLWRVIGIDRNQKTKRAKTVWVHIRNLLKEILDEETTVCNDMKQRIETCRVKIQELSTALSVSLEEVDGGSLIHQEEILRQQMEILSKLKNQRLKNYQDLKNSELQLCQILKMPEHQLLSNTGVPTINDLKELKTRIDMLITEKENRHSKFCLAKKELTTIWEATELKPETPLEIEILSEKEDVSLSNERLKALEEIISKAKRRKLELEAEKKVLMNKLNTLWERLKVDQRKRNEFLSNHVDYRLSTIQSIQKEIERCEKVKADNLKMFIGSLRQELNNLWDKCCVSERVKQEFEHFSNAEVTDEVLEAHEAAVDKWNKYYEDVQHIIKKIEKRKELWELMIVFENKAADPNRFKNRKGNLLQEEKERKKLQKDLPALESSIFQDIEAYEAEHGSPFLYYDGDYRRFVADQWKERNEQKEREKEERQKQRLLESNIVAGTPEKRSLLTTPKSTRSKTPKSHAGLSKFQTPIAAQSSRMVPSSSGKSRHKVTKLLSSRSPAIQRKDQKVIAKQRNQADSLQLGASPEGTTYADFASELNLTSRRNLRSSVLATRKPGGTRISLNSNKNKKSRKSKSGSSSIQITTPSREKPDLPILK